MGFLCFGNRHKSVPQSAPTSPVIEASDTSTPKTDVPGSDAPQSDPQPLSNVNPDSPPTDPKEKRTSSTSESKATPPGPKNEAYAGHAGHVGGSDGDNGDGGHSAAMTHYTSTYGGGPEHSGHIGAGDHGGECD